MRAPVDHIFQGKPDLACGSPPGVPQDRDRQAKRGCWIHVADKLPRSEQHVLIFVDAPPQRGVSFAYWDRGMFWDHNWPWTLQDVQYWMELPTPPSSSAAGDSREPLSSGNTRFRQSYSVCEG